MTTTTSNSRMGLPEARVLYDQLREPPIDAPASWYQRRGRRLESILLALLEADGLQPRTSYRAKGEEIDGSFVFDGRVFLLEAKWHKDPLPASMLYSFKGKVDSRLVGTLGLFISMSGYGEDAVDALTKGKHLNLLLFDEYDIETALRTEGHFRTLLSAKLRAAAEEGTVYLRAARYLQSLVIGAARPEFSADRDDRLRIASELRFGFVCEGRTDEMILRALLHRLISKYQPTGRFPVVLAGGYTNLSKIANIIGRQGVPKVFVLVDADGNAVGRLQEIQRTLNVRNVEILPLDPNMEEAWLSISSAQNQYAEGAGQGSSLPSRLSAIAQRISAIDIEELAGRDPSFARISAAFSSLDKPTGACR